MASAFHNICNQSYTLHLLTRHFSQSSTPTASHWFPHLTFTLATHLLLLLTLATIFHFLAPSLRDGHLCRIYAQSLGELTHLSAWLRTRNASSSLEGHAQCPVKLSPVLWQGGKGEACSIIAGPEQQTPMDILGSFGSVSLGGLKEGCLFEVIASGTGVSQTLLLPPPVCFPSGDPLLPRVL